MSPVLRWDRRPSARRFWELARFLDERYGTIVEIGSYLGNSTVYLAKAGGTVHAVDPHSEQSMSQVPGDEETSKRFESNLERFGVRDRVSYHRATSTEAAASWNGEPVRLLYVDGLHTEDAVLADYHAWRPHLASVHAVLFDDYLWPSVHAAIDQLRAQYRPPHFYVRGGQALFSTERLPLRVVGLP